MVRFHAIGKLRCEANLKFLYQGSYWGRGAPHRFDGKVNLKDPQRFQFVKHLEDSVSLYTAVVWSVSLKRKIRLAYLLKEPQGRRSYVVLFSTDLDIDPLLLCRCYPARSQIEFIFGDARQFTGLTDCQARYPEAINTHVNASLMALNLAKLALQQNQTDDDSLSFSPG